METSCQLQKLFVIAQGTWQKDAKYIIFFQDKGHEFDPLKVYTDYFFFDGAANVQKDGQTLCAHFP